LNLSSVDSLAADTLGGSLVNDFEDELSDTTQVSLADDKQGEEKIQEEISTVPKVKEPLWNPRKRR
jgi:hypothetical protein